MLTQASMKIVRLQ